MSEFPEGDEFACEGYSDSQLSAGVVSTALSESDGDKRKAVESGGGGGSGLSAGHVYCNVSDTSPIGTNVEIREYNTSSLVAQSGWSRNESILVGNAGDYFHYSCDVPAGCVFWKWHLSNGTDFYGYVANDGDGIYETYNPSQLITAYVNLSASNPIMVTASCDAGLTTNPSGVSYVTVGSGINYNIVAVAGHELGSVFVNGTLVYSFPDSVTSSSYQLRALTGNTTIYFSSNIVGGASSSDTSGFDSATLTFINLVIAWLVPLIVLLVPSIIMGAVGAKVGIGGWGFVVGVNIGAFLGFAMLPLYVPLGIPIAVIALDALIISGRVILG